MNDRRAAQRSSILSGARLRIGETEREALVHDINEYGCRLTVSFRLEPNSSLHISIGLPGLDEPIEVSAVVAWVEPITLTGSFQAGLRFVEFDKPQHFQQLSVTLDKERIKRDSLEKLHPLVGSVPLTEMSSLEAKRLAFLAEFSRHLNHSHEPVEVAQIAVNSVAEILRAERVALMVDRGGPDPEILACWGMEPEPTSEGSLSSFPYSRFVVKKVFNEGRAMLSFDVAGDKRLDTSSLDVLGTRSILCVPLIVGGRVLGVVYMDNNLETSAFSECDREVAVVLCELTAFALERARYLGKLVQVEKMGALGTLTASLAHELSSPLTVISGITEFLKLEPVDLSMVEDLSLAAKRCLDLVRDITNWSRLEDTPVENVQLEEVLRTTLRLVGPGLVRSDVQLKVQFHQPVPMVKGHTGQLTQVLVNLINNARQALEGKEDGTISIEGSATDREVYLSVQDNGPGVPPQNLTRIFDPFFTTKAKGEGTGLGLSISRDILSRYGGRLEVRNLPAGGVRFQVCLPIPRLSSSAPKAKSA